MASDEVTELLAALVAAAGDAEEALIRFRRLFARCRAQGVGFDRLARALLRRRGGEVSLAERRREVERLKRAFARDAVTSCPGFVRLGSTSRRGSTVGCRAKEGGPMPDPKRLFRRITERTTEEFVPEHELFPDNAEYSGGTSEDEAGFTDDYQNDVSHDEGV